MINQRFVPVILIVVMPQTTRRPFNGCIQVAAVCIYCGSKVIIIQKFEIYELANTQLDAPMPPFDPIHLGA